MALSEKSKLERSLIMDRRRVETMRSCLLRDLSADQRAWLLPRLARAEKRIAKNAAELDALNGGDK